MNDFFKPFKAVTKAEWEAKLIADLKGKKVGFSVAGVEEALLTTILARNGLSMTDIELVNVNWSLSPSLMSGQVDAVIGAFRNFELNQMGKYQFVFQYFQYLDHQLQIMSIL